TIDGHPHSVARLTVSKRSRLVSQSVLEIEERFQASVILLNHGGQPIQHPPAAMKICSGDELAIFGGPEQINQIVHENQ
ncbi:hypothetical protein EG834_10990, partial [bacterium]|nr:hypothetical protein [bacterium]